MQGRRHRPLDKRERSEPGGKRERGETTRACASRELYEEMRLSADDLEIDWDRPIYDEQCKYTFFRGALATACLRPRRSLRSTSAFILTMRQPNTPTG